MKIIVTGANGQLAKCLRDDVKESNNHTWVWLDHDYLDIGNHEDVENIIKIFKPNVVINCAAYTNVTNAEDEKDLAMRCNSEGVKNLKDACSKIGCKIIHISTDYVFDGKKSSAYTEEDKENPLNAYGASKLEGESFLSLDEDVIIRTSWLYSEHGKNFLRTMLNKMESNDDISVVDDQIGSPTYAKDLGQFIIRMINDENFDNFHGLYHYTNEGIASWYDFAVAIRDILGFNNVILPVKSSGTLKRPAFSKLDCTKLKKDFNIEIPNWQYGLRRCLVRCGVKMMIIKRALD